MKKILSILIILGILICSAQAQRPVIDFPMTPAQEDTLSSLPPNLVHNYIRRLRRTHRIDEEFLRNNPMTASREGAGIVLAHDYGQGFTRFMTFLNITNDTGQSQ